MDGDEDGTVLESTSLFKRSSHTQQAAAHLAHYIANRGVRFTRDEVEENIGVVLIRYGIILDEGLGDHRHLARELRQRLLTLADRPTTDELRYELGVLDEDGFIYHVPPRERALEVAQEIEDDGVALAHARWAPPLP